MSEHNLTFEVVALVVGVIYLGVEGTNLTAVEILFLAWVLMVGWVYTRMKLRKSGAGES